MGAPSVGRCWARVRGPDCANDKGHDGQGQDKARHHQGGSAAHKQLAAGNQEQEADADSDGSEQQVRHKIHFFVEVRAAPRRKTFDRVASASAVEAIFDH